MLERVKEIIEEKLGLDGVEIKAETSFKDDLGVDSLDLFELVMALEDEFGTEIPSEDLEQLTTVGAVVEYIENKKNSVWTYLKTIKCKEFWFGTINVAFLLTCSIGLMSQSNAIITAYEDELQFVGGYTGVMAMIMIFGCIGSFVLGLIDTKFGTKKAMIISACLMIVSAILGQINSGVALLLAMVFVALFMGASSNFGVSCAAQYWRREDFSRVFTLSSPIGSMISSASPVVIAKLLFTADNTYKGQSGAFMLVAVCGVVALVVMLLFKPDHIKAMDDKFRAAAGKPLDDALVGRK